MKKEAIIFGLGDYKEMAEAVAKKSKIELGYAEISNFADGEIFVQANTSVRGKEVFILVSTCRPVNDNLMTLLLFIDAVKRASSKEINIIIPYFGYSRQDRKIKGRQSISAKLVAKLLETAGANRIITFDIHSEQTQGFFDIPVDILRATGIIAREIKRLNLKDVVVVTPDHGGIYRARRLAEALGKNYPIAVIDKRRTGKNEAKSTFILGNVKGKTAILVDDLIDTAGTLIEAIKKLKAAGSKVFYVAATHGVFSKKPNDSITPQEKLFKLGVKKIIITNSIYPKKIYKEQIVIDLSDAIAGVVAAHLNNESITSYYIKHFSTQL